MCRNELLLAIAVLFELNEIVIMPALPETEAPRVATAVLPANALGPEIPGTHYLFPLCFGFGPGFRGLRTRPTIPPGGRGRLRLPTAGRCGRAGVSPGSPLPAAPFKKAFQSGTIASRGLLRRGNRRGRPGAPRCSRANPRHCVPVPRTPGSTPMTTLGNRTS